MRLKNFLKFQVLSSIFVILAMAFLDSTRAEVGLVATGSYYFSDGKSGRVIHDSDLSLVLKYFGNNRIGLGYQNIGKSYRGVPIKYDRLVRFENAFGFLSQFYLATSYERNISKHYSYKNAVGVDLHYLPIESIDLGFGTKWRDYSSIDTFILTPTIAITTIPMITISGRSDVLVKPSLLISGEGKIEFHAFSMFSLRASIGGGKSDEGESLIDKFYQTTYGFSWTILGPLEIFGDFQIYRGNLRDENKFGGGLRCSF